MKILGYSERGIINSLMFSIGYDLELLTEFIQLIDIPELKELGNPIDYEILLEQSFSDFGDADLIVITKYTETKIVLFIEGKVKTYQKKYWNITEEYKKYTKEEKYNGSASNLFFQLYLKSMLMLNRDKIKLKKDSIIEAKHRSRKLGNNDVVYSAFKNYSIVIKPIILDLFLQQMKRLKSLSGMTKQGINIFLGKKSTNFAKKIN